MVFSGLGICLVGQFSILFLGFSPEKYTVTFRQSCTALSTLYASPTRTARPPATICSRHAIKSSCSDLMLIEPKINTFIRYKFWRKDKNAVRQIATHMEDLLLFQNNAIDSAFLIIYLLRLVLFLLYSCVFIIRVSHAMKTQLLSKRSAHCSLFFNLRYFLIQ